MIDEVSMVGTALLGCVSRRLSQVLNNEAPLGGLVVVLSGDFDQLSPVKSPSLAHLALGCIPVRPIYIYKTPNTPLSPAPAAAASLPMSTQDARDEATRLGRYTNGNLCSCRR